MNPKEQKEVGDYAVKLHEEEMAKEREENSFKPFQRINTDHTKEFEALPSFPVDVLPEPLRQYALDVADSLQVDVAMPAVIGLSIVAAASASVYRMEPKHGWNEPLNLYTATIANPSERKSPVINEMSFIVHEYERDWNQSHAEEIKKSREEKGMLLKREKNIIEALSKPDGGGTKCENLKTQLNQVRQELEELEEVNPLILIRGGNVTPEALEPLLARNNERMFICTDEGRLIGIVSGGYSDKDASTNSELLLQAYFGNFHTSDRISRESVTLENPNLTISLCIQPKPIRKAIEGGALEGVGFFERFLFCFPRSRIGSREYDSGVIGFRAQAGFRDIIRKLYDFQTGEDAPFGRKDREPGEPLVIRWSEEAHTAAKVFFDDMEKVQSEARDNNEYSFLGWAGKAHGTGMRIAAIIHIIKHVEDAAAVELEAETVVEAIMIMHYFQEHAHTIFRCFGAESENDALYLWKRIRELANGRLEVDKQTVYQNTKHRFDKAEALDVALEELYESGYCMVHHDKNGKPGRPKDVIILNPEAVE